MFGGHDDNGGGQQNDSNLQIPEGAFSGPDDNTQTPEPPTDNDKAGDYIMSDQPQPTSTAVVPPTNMPSDSAMPTPADDALLNLKQQALQQLTPLLQHLDQSPEEKFRTTMMMIQASDNADLLKEAFAAAQAITDEKAKAQALLDVVNEINYFSQNSSPE